VEERFQRLRLDSLPLVLLPDPEGLSLKAATAHGGPLGALVGLRDQGLIRHLAIEGGPVDLQLKYLATDAFDAVFSHIPYNLVDRAAEPLIQNAVSRGVAFVNAAPFTGNLLLQGAATPTQCMNLERNPAHLERSDKMRLICAAHGIPLAAAALQFSTLDPRVASTIVGVSTPSQADFVTDLAQWKIPAAAWDDLLDLVEETDLAGSCRDDVIPTTGHRLTGISV
jgi:D-threo-aldose 1-dehydrogenase